MYIAVISVTTFHLQGLYQKTDSLERFQSALQNFAEFIFMLTT